jgi:hypothetical protein
MSTLFDAAIAMALILGAQQVASAQGPAKPDCHALEMDKAVFRGDFATALV